MRSGLLLAQLALWSSSANAFYPYTPKWAEELNNKRNLDSRNADSSAIDDNDKGFTLAVRRRGGKPSGPVFERAAREASYLANKYRGRSPTPADDDDAALTVSKRDNQYDIMEAEPTDERLTAGIDQDGADYSYFVEAELGSGGKELYMLLDTGAGSSWVMGSDCSSKACSMHNSFGPDDSSTYKSTGETFSVSYGSGSVDGELATDTLGVAGVSFDFKLGIASKTSDDFTHFAFDGILGLSMNSGSGDNFLTVLRESGDVDASVFSVSLHRAADGENDGEIKFGSPDEDKYTGDITYVDIDSDRNDWTIPLDDTSYDGKSSKAGGVSAYIDTGTTFIFGPESLVKAFHSVIPGAESSDGTSYKVPCDSSAPLTFTFGGQEFEISSKDWISPEASDGSCTSNIYGQEVIKGSWLLGATFIKNVYTVFDKDEKRIGFAKHAEEESSASPTSTSAPSSTVTEAPGSTTTELESSSTMSGNMTAMPSLGGGVSGSEEPTTTASGSKDGDDSKPSDPPDSSSSTFDFSKLAFSVCIATAFALIA